MVVLGLLLVALVCLILGLILTSAAFLTASVVASIVAGIVLWRQRGQMAAKSAASSPAATGASPEPATRQTSLVTGTAFAANPTDGPDDAAAASNGAAHEDDVWVVDGQPLFHARGCDQLAGHDAEPVPYAQAVDDGFTECSACKPQVGADVTEVWVVDGQPEYHLKDCTHVSDGAQQIPRAQAVEDGFSPCADCRPDTPAAPTPKSAPAPAPAAESAPDAAPGAEAAPAPEAAPTPAVVDDVDAAPAPPARVSSRPDGVWVVDGRPRYHLADCLIIKDVDAEEIPVAQATEDGFIPCSMCEPNVSRV